MAPRTWSIAMLASLLLAGCAQEEPVTETAAPTVILVTDENDVDSLSNESFMMSAHQHDYWGGLDRLVVLEGTTTTGGMWFGGAFGHRMGLEDGVVIPHGTSRVEVTVTWSDPAISIYSNPELWVKTAADHETQLVGPVASGDTVVIETDDADADLPHQGVSNWLFEWRIHPGNPAGGPGLVRQGPGSDLTMRAEAIRGREIPIYPPHPDLWQDRGEIALFAHERPHGIWTGSIERDSDEWSCVRSCPMIHAPDNGTVVPFDATLVEVVVDGAPDAPFDFGIKFRGATSRDWTDLVPTRVEGTLRIYEIPVTPGLGDSPYATQSVWGFTPFSEKPERDGWFSGAYAISARALREPPSG